MSGDASNLKLVIRSVIQFGNDDDSALVSNFLALRRAKLEWINPADESVYRFVVEFYEREMALPEGRVITNYFDGAEQIEVVQRIQDFEHIKLAYTGGNFTHVLKTAIEAQQKAKLAQLLKQTLETAVKGLTLNKGTRKEVVLKPGVQSAVEHLMRNDPWSLVPSDMDPQTTKGDLRDVADEVIADYYDIKLNPSKAYGAFCGINDIDDVTLGIKRGELWVHAAHVGELKTTLALNWAYNLVTKYRRNVFYVSLEMPYAQVRNIIYVMHSSHAKWRKQGHVPLDYAKVKSGKLTPSEEVFFKEVVEDFRDSSDYCRFELWCPDHEVTVADIRREAMSIDREMEIGTIFIDHAGLVRPSIKSDNYTVALNSVFREAKQLALQFDRGKGVPVVCLHQTSREGKDKAEKAGGLYTSTSALSWAHEAERSADVVSTTYLDDALRADGRVRLQCLKNRDAQKFPTCEVDIQWSCRRLSSASTGSLAADAAAAAEVSLADLW